MSSLLKFQKGKYFLFFYFTFLCCESTQKKQNSEIVIKSRLGGKSPIEKKITQIKKLQDQFDELIHEEPIKKSFFKKADKIKINDTEKLLENLTKEENKQKLKIVINNFYILESTLQNNYTKTKKDKKNLETLNSNVQSLKNSISVILNDVGEYYYEKILKQVKSLEKKTYSDINSNDQDIEFGKIIITDDKEDLSSAIQKNKDLVKEYLKDLQDIITKFKDYILFYNFLKKIFENISNNKVIQKQYSGVISLNNWMKTDLCDKLNNLFLGMEVSRIFFNIFEATDHSSIKWDVLRNVLKNFAYKNKEKILKTVEMSFREFIKKFATKVKVKGK